MDFIGVDACKKGWFAVALDSKNGWEIGIFPSFDDLWIRWHPWSVIFIDIPIGLPNTRRRACDLVARKMLGKRGSSVFPAPCREALQAATYRRACRINKRVTGAKLSIQTWNICTKIREIDSWLRNHPVERPTIRESHPELCFRALAGGMPMAYSKKRPQGFAERHALLESAYPHTAAIVDRALHRFKRKDLARDDILDALALAVSAGQSLKSIRTIPSDPPGDEKGLPMEIVYAVPTLTEFHQTNKDRCS